MLIAETWIMYIFIKLFQVSLFNSFIFAFMVFFCLFVIIALKHGFVIGWIKRRNYVYFMIIE
jgi:hypothetical protein